jgi:hypothetical protein
VARGKIPTNHTSPPQPLMDQTTHKTTKTDLEQRGAHTTDIRAHWSASLQRSVARDDYPGLAEPEVAPLASIFQVAAVGCSPMAVVHVSTCFTGRNHLHQRVCKNWSQHKATNMRGEIIVYYRSWIVTG